TRLDGTELIVNSDMIEFVESTPDTILTLTDGKKVIVKEEPGEVIERIIHFRNRVMAPFTESQASDEAEG
ncbi:MAG TPA: flagellar protein FlbD, partial [Bacteroidetes bacterium]|nr:flagellar protein FlbD [Bacteroidota bacterium]